MKIVEILERNLAKEKEGLKKRREYFLVMVNNEMNTTCFEKNAISELLIMQEHKNNITAIEKYLMLARIYSEK